MNQPDDYFYEPNEFEQQVDELKASLLNAVRDEHKAEMERLRKENAELQEVKKNFEDIKRDYNQKVVELDMQKRSIKQEVRKERLQEIMSDFQVQLFTARQKWENGPKCDKCDLYRRIHFKSPLGRDVTEDCSCKNQITYFKPKLNICTSLEINNGELIAWYKYFTGEDGLDLEELSSSNVPRFIYSGQDFESITEHPYRVYFKTEEECQTYCDWLTAKEAKG